MRALNEELEKIINSERNQGLEGFKKSIFDRFADTNYTAGFEWDDQLDKHFEELKQLLDCSTTKTDIIDSYLTVEKKILKEISEFYYDPTHD